MRQTRKVKLTVKAAAKKLRVTREHLSRVIHGRRESRSLLLRYTELKERFEKTNASS